MALKSFAKRFYSLFVPFNSEELDAPNNYALETFAGAIGEIYQDVDDLARDTEDGKPGWSIIIDVDRCPSYGLKWLAQWTGTVLDDSWTDEQKRTAIRTAGRWNRGTLSAMTEAIQNTLTGTKQVTIIERDTSAYHFSVSTRLSETPDLVATERALLSQKPAGLQYTYAAIPDWTWGDLSDGYADWQAVNDAFLTWQNVNDNTPI